MTREGLKENLLKVTKAEKHEELKNSMEKLSTEALAMCLNTFHTREGDQKAKYLVGLQVNNNNTVDVSMENSQGKFYGVSIILK